MIFFRRRNFFPLFFPPAWALPGLLRCNARSMISGSDIPKLEREWTSWDPWSLQFDDIHILLRHSSLVLLWKGNTLNLEFRASKPPGTPRAPEKQRKNKKQTKKKTNKDKRRKTMKKTKTNKEKQRKRGLKGARHHPRRLRKIFTKKKKVTRNRDEI